MSESRTLARKMRVKEKHGEERVCSPTKTSSKEEKDAKQRKSFHELVNERKSSLGESRQFWLHSRSVQT